LQDDFAIKERNESESVLRQCENSPCDENLDQEGDQHPRPDRQHRLATDACLSVVFQSCLLMTQSVTLTIPYEDSVSLLPIRKDAKAGASDSSANQTVFFILIILIWYSVSVGHNLLNKRLLEGDLFPFPFTLTLLQLSAITVYSFIYIGYFSNDEIHVITSIREVLSYRRNRNLIIGLSLGKFLTLVFSHLSLTQVPLAFTHTGESDCLLQESCN
jgi:hypothetical protein